jgi:hypothetical protein
MLADKMARQWTGIERAMKFANHKPAFRPQVEYHAHERAWRKQTVMGALVEAA